MSTRQITIVCGQKTPVRIRLHNRAWHVFVEDSAYARGEVDRKPWQFALERNIREGRDQPLGGMP